jgi:hypothetical protein
MISAHCHLCGDIMKPPCVEHHRCNVTIDTQFPGKVFRIQNDKHQYSRGNKQLFVKNDKSRTMCRFGDYCLSVSCATHCKLPSFVPVKGSKNCNKGDKCPAIVGCHFSHNSMQCSVNSTN